MFDNVMIKNKDRGAAHPTVPKAGITRHRRRLELGGKYED